MKPVASVCGTPLFALPDVGADEQLLLISDLHLGPDTAAATAAFGAALQWARTTGVRRVLVLGDLFDFWVGSKQIQVPGFAAAVAQLRAAVAAGLELTLLWGNRDFALDPTFARRTGVTVVPGGLALRAGARRLALLHGDELCWNDVPYQRSKRWLRAPWLRLGLRHLPLMLSLRLAGAARTRSRMNGPAGDPERWWPVAEAMAEVAQAGFSDVVFGHIHHPAAGVFRTADGPSLGYTILPAFDATGVVATLGVAGPAHRDPRTGAAVAYPEFRFPALRPGVAGKGTRPQR